jgi:hypothetical protein
MRGAIVALDPEGIPRFQLLQQWQKQPTAPRLLFVSISFAVTDETLPVGL